MKNKDRYIRQTLLPEIGDTGQEKLYQSSVMVVGCGGLGCIVAPYLAGAGIGTLILVDGDTIDTSNLHRQIIYQDGDYRAKAEALAAHCTALNPDIKIISHVGLFTKENAEMLAAQVDVIMDCTDDEDTKYLINDTCMAFEKVFVYGGMHQFDGYVALFDGHNKEQVNLRDIFPHTPGKLASCSDIGVYNITAGTIGLQQANTLLKHILQIGENLLNVLQVFDVLYNRNTQIPIFKTKYYNFKQLIINSLSTTCDTILDQNSLEITKEQYESLPSSHVNRLAINLGNKEIWTNISGLALSEIGELLLDSKTNVILCPRGNTSLRIIKELEFSGALEGKKVYSLNGGMMGLG